MKDNFPIGLVQIAQGEKFRRQGINYFENIYPMCSLFSLSLADEYDTRCYFNVRSKADISQLNLPQSKVAQYHNNIVTFWMTDCAGAAI